MARFQSGENSNLEFFPVADDDDATSLEHHPPSHPFQPARVSIRRRAPASPMGLRAFTCHPTIHGRRSGIDELP
jgi:hypothetical protein